MKTGSTAHYKMLQSSYSANLIEAGLDEVGRGCLAGPVMAAAVILPATYTHPILNDSKQLSRTQRERVRTDILQDALSWSVAEVSNEVIDQINILKASFWLCTGPSISWRFGLSICSLMGTDLHPTPCCRIPAL